MIEVPYIALGRPESISLVANHLCLVVQSLLGTVVDGHSEIVHQVILVASKQSGEIAHRFELEVRCLPEPSIEIPFAPPGIGIGPECPEGFFVLFSVPSPHEILAIPPSL